MNEIKTLKWMYIQLTLTSYFEVYVSRPTSYVRTPSRRLHQGISSLRGTHPSYSARVAPRSSLLWRALTSQSSTFRCRHAGLLSQEEDILPQGAPARQRESLSFSCHVLCLDVFSFFGCRRVWKKQRVRGNLSSRSRKIFLHADKDIDCVDSTEPSQCITR
jgi:hypothetical protein